jgi:hypothetical protein
MMHRGTLFIALFFGLAPGVTILLLWRGVHRGIREVQSRGRILVVAGTALAVWSAATYYMFAATFATAWSVAHMRPVPAGMFPEGWMIYGLLAAYTMLGGTLRSIVGKMPRKRAA